MNNTKYKQVIIVLIVVACIGCNKRMLPPTSAEHIVYTAHNLSLLNGIYQNTDSIHERMIDSSVARYRKYTVVNNLPAPTVSGKPYTNLSGLLQLTDISGNYETEKEFHIKLEVLNTKTIQATLFKNKQNVTHKILKGKIKKGYFKTCIEKKWKGIPLIYYQSSKKNLYLGTDNQHNLLVYSRGRVHGAIFIFAGGGYNEIDLKFHSIK